MLKDKTLASLTHVSHGFFGRRGGVSDGIYASLNCGFGSGDDIQKVAENRKRVAHQIGAPVLTCFQIHSNKVITVDTAWEWKHSPEADAMVTNKPGIALSILTADCLPVLFACRKNKVIGAAHAGWKGAIFGVLEATMDAMKTLGATDIVAAIGPAIAQNSYEVGPEFEARFAQESPTNSAYFKPSSKNLHYLFDLRGYARDRLKKAGCIAVNILANDTCFEENEFFSYRRATLAKEQAYGRQISSIALR
jgi:YfiH family protein